MPDVTLDDAIKEAYASAPTEEPPLFTLELRHPAFTTPIRVVRDNANLTATLEASAPVDAGQVVEFIAYRFDLAPPSVEAGGTPEIVIDLDNINREITLSLEAAVALPDMIEATFRVFLPSDPSGPQNDPPMTMVLRHVSVGVFKVTARAGFEDLANKGFPVQDYTVARFPALSR